MHASGALVQATQTTTRHGKLPISTGKIISNMLHWFEVSRNITRETYANRGLDTEANQALLIFIIDIAQ
jgi:hypothetical protein